MISVSLNYDGGGGEGGGGNDGAAVAASAAAAAAADDDDDDDDDEYDDDDDDDDLTLMSCKSFNKVVVSLKARLKAWSNTSGLGSSSVIMTSTTSST
jgi:hypothetical protein